MAIAWRPTHISLRYLHRLAAKAYKAIKICCCETHNSEELFVQVNLCSSVMCATRPHFRWIFPFQLFRPSPILGSPPPGSLGIWIKLGRSSPEPITSTNWNGNNRHMQQCFHGNKDFTSLHPLQPTRTSQNSYPDTNMQNQGVYAAQRTRGLGNT
jgi:hypothetical protein